MFDGCVEIRDARAVIHQV